MDVQLDRRKRSGDFHLPIKVFQPRCNLDQSAIAMLTVRDKLFVQHQISDVIFAGCQMRLDHQRVEGDEIVSSLGMEPLPFDARFVIQTFSIDESGRAALTSASPDDLKFQLPHRFHEILMNTFSFLREDISALSSRADPMSLVNKAICENRMLKMAFPYGISLYLVEKFAQLKGNLDLLIGSRLNGAMSMSGLITKSSVISNAIRLEMSKHCLETETPFRRAWEIPKTQSQIASHAELRANSEVVGPSVKINTFQELRSSDPHVKVINVIDWYGYSLFMLHRDLERQLPAILCGRCGTGFFKLDGRSKFCSVDNVGTLVYDRCRAAFDAQRQGKGRRLQC